MSYNSKALFLAALIAVTSLALPNDASAKATRSPHSKHQPAYSAPVHLDQRLSRVPKWGDLGFYDGWTPPPARAGGVG
jgi:hypothetical protein